MPRVLPEVGSTLLIHLCADCGNVEGANPQAGCCPKCGSTRGDLARAHVIVKEYVEGDYWPRAVESDAEETTSYLLLGHPAWPGNLDTTSAERAAEWYEEHVANFPVYVDRVVARRDRVHGRRDA